MAMQLSLSIPKSFKESYLNFKSFPANTIHKSSYPTALKGYALRLEQFAPRLFQQQTDKIHVLFREFTGIGNDSGLQKKDATNDAVLREWLGDLSTSTPAGGLVTKKDPKCRFIFINADSSLMPLNTTRDMLLRILTYHQVMPVYLDFLSVFGTQNEARDLRFSGFHEQITLTSFPQEAITELERSGRAYQLTYNLKSVACKSKNSVEMSKKQWSIRQAALHHQFDVVNGTTLWVITQAHLTIKERIQEMTAVHGRPEDRDFRGPAESFRTSLTTHLLCCHWSVEEWRWYVQWLEEVIEKETERAIYEARGMEHHQVYTPSHIQIVQHREDKTNEAIMVMTANIDVMVAIREFYKRLSQNKDFDLKATCSEDISSFIAQIDDLIYDSKMQISRATVLIKITADRKGLILQHLQSQATTKMEELTRLTIKIGTMAQREAIAMRIITVVTLIYLPATFVSTFFSTDVIKYQNSNYGDASNSSSIEGTFMGSFSKIALQRWPQVTLPLTVITLIVGWIAFKSSGRKADAEFSLALLPIHEESEKS